MIGSGIAAAMLLVALNAPAAAQSSNSLAPATKPVASKLNTTDSELGTMLDEPAAKAVLVKYIPKLVSDAQVDMARSLTLKQLQSYVPDQLTDETLAKIDGDLAKLPSK